MTVYMRRETSTNSKCILRDRVIYSKPTVCRQTLRPRYFHADGALGPFLIFAVCLVFPLLTLHSRSLEEVNAHIGTDLSKLYMKLPLSFLPSIIHVIDDFLGSSPDKSKTLAGLFHLVSIIDIPIEPQ